MKVVMLSLAVLATITAAVSARIAWREYRRLRLLRTIGARTKGVICGEALRRIGEAPLPIVRFEDEKGSFREFRSHYPRRTRGYIHPEVVEVLYGPDSAEIAAVAPAVRWISRYVAFSALLLTVGVFMALLSLR
jgi:hypothetical protein